MSAHQLFLEIPHTNNPRIFRVVDTSIYSSQIPVVSEQLEIIPPGFNAPIVVVPPSGENFSLALNACSLGLQIHDCANSSQVLPDGIYNVRYSVSPNSNVYVEYNHLRVTQFINCYNQKLCNLEMAACEPSADVKEQLNQLRLIKSYIDAAKVKVEDCHDNQTGMDLLLYAQKLLTKLNGKSCGCNHNCSCSY